MWETHSAWRGRHVAPLHRTTWWWPTGPTALLALPHALSDARDRARLLQQQVRGGASRPGGAQALPAAGHARGRGEACVLALLGMHSLLWDTTEPALSLQLGMLADSMPVAAVSTPLIPPPCRHCTPVVLLSQPPHPPLARPPVLRVSPRVRAPAARALPVQLHPPPRAVPVRAALLIRGPARHGNGLQHASGVSGWGMVLLGIRGGQWRTVPVLSCTPWQRP